jgi:NAD(P)-dependent dehydrogenase (short-subunit alcohol dehydrogenase family)
MEISLSGKSAVVTGGSSGIGLEIARQFVDAGAYVFITGRRQSELDAAVAAIGKNVSSICADSANLSDLDRVFEVAGARTGKIDILVANAGILKRRSSVK